MSLLNSLRKKAVENVPKPHNEPLSTEKIEIALDKKDRELKKSVPEAKEEPVNEVLKVQLEEYNNDYNGIFSFGNPKDHELNILFGILQEIKINNILMNELVELVKKEK